MGACAIGMSFLARYNQTRKLEVPLDETLLASSFRQTRAVRAFVLKAREVRTSSVDFREKIAQVADRM